MDMLTPHIYQSTCSVVLLILLDYHPSAFPCSEGKKLHIEIYAKYQSA